MDKKQRPVKIPTRWLGCSLLWRLHQMSSVLSSRVACPRAGVDSDTAERHLIVRLDCCYFLQWLNLFFTDWSSSAVVSGSHQEDEYFDLVLFSIFLFLFFYIHPTYTSVCVVCF